MISDTISKALEWCVYRRTPFVLFKEPNSKKPRFFCAPSLQKEGRAERPVEGFFIGQFGQKSEDFLWIPFELNAYETWQQRNRLPDNSMAAKFPQQPDTLKADYVGCLDELIPRLRERKHGKTVISRIKTDYLFSHKIGDIMEELMECSYTDFTYCFYHPAVGCWLGATPEFLLSYAEEDNVFLTESLAGTKPINEEWDEKNIEEHEVVTDVIMSQFLELGLAPVPLKRIDKKYGSIKHLQTVIFAVNEGGRADPFELVDVLNPTPALCGNPREEAMADIKELELHQRSCYGGVIGVAEKKYFSAYVNIRCANFEGSRFTFFAGGGIMPDSVPEDEWEETNRKIDNLKYRMMN